MNILEIALVCILICVIILVINPLCKKFIFSKVRINKWIPLAIAVALFVIQVLIGQSNIYVSSVFSIFTVVFLLWFMEIMQTGRPKKKEKQIIIKPKAKPNRVKKNK